MMGILQGQVDGQSFVITLIILFIVGYFFYKEWPEFKRRIAESQKREAEDTANDRKLADRMNDFEKRLDEHQVMLSRDYKKINALEDSIEINRLISTQTLEEMEIIMRALLGVLDSLQALGDDTASKAVKDAQNEINEYLTKIAHKNPSTRYLSTAQTNAL